MENIEEIYNEYASTVYKYILCICKNPQLAEEITQETFVIAIKKIHQFRGECKISVWLCQIAKHLLYKHYKKENNLKEISLNTFEDLKIDECIEERLEEKENKIKLYKIIQMLDEKTRGVIYLRIQGDLSFKEIGEILNKSESWARVTFFRGKQKIKEELKNEREV